MTSAVVVVGRCVVVVTGRAVVVGRAVTGAATVVVVITRATVVVGRIVVAGAAVVVGRAVVVTGTVVAVVALVVEVGSVFAAPLEHAPNSPMAMAAAASRILIPIGFLLREMCSNGTKPAMPATWPVRAICRHQAGDVIVITPMITECP